MSLLLWSGSVIENVLSIVIRADHGWMSHGSMGKLVMSHTYDGSGGSWVTNVDPRSTLIVMVSLFHWKKHVRKSDTYEFDNYMVKG